MRERLLIVTYSILYSVHYYESSRNEDRLKNESKAAFFIII